MKLSPQQIAWLKGAEKAVAVGIVTGVGEAHIGGLPTTKAGWLKFGSIVAAAGYAAVRLYLKQSPLTGVFPPLAQS
jgi:hypothetical protein